MSAARRKGKWTGGVPVLGYDIASGGRKLVINEGEAIQVRRIFDLYSEHPSLEAVILLTSNNKVGRRNAGSPAPGNRMGEILDAERRTGVASGARSYTGRVYFQGDSITPANTVPSSKKAPGLMSRACSTTNVPKNRSPPALPEKTESIHP